MKYLQQATLWRATPDGFGGYTFSAPEVINCRWVEKQELIPGSSSELSKSVVYTEIDISIEDHMFLGVSNATSPIGLVGAYKVRMYSKIPDLRNLTANRKSWLV